MRFQPKEANEKLLQKKIRTEWQKEGTKGRGVEEKQKGDYGMKK